MDYKNALGEIKVHYVGPDTWEFAPYFYSNAGDDDQNYFKMEGVDPDLCLPHNWYEVHEVVYYDTNCMLTLYECRYHVFSLFNGGYVINGPYNEKHWQIKQESLDKFYESI